MRRGCRSTSRCWVGSCRFESGCSRSYGGEGDRSRRMWAGVQAGGGACSVRAGATRAADWAFDVLLLLLARRSVRLWEDLALSGSLAYVSRAGWQWRGLVAGGAGMIHLAYLTQVAVVPPSPPPRSLVPGSARDSGVFLSGLGVTVYSPGLRGSFCPL